MLVFYVILETKKLNIFCWLQTILSLINGVSTQFLVFASKVADRIFSR